MVFRPKLDIQAGTLDVEDEQDEPTPSTLYPADGSGQLLRS
jgi:hypothetical protein